MNDELFNHRLSALEIGFKDMEKKSKDMCSRILCMESKQNQLSEKVESLEKYNELIMSLSFEMKNLVEKIEQLVNIINKQEERIDNVESKPGNSALKYWGIVASAVVTAVTGLVLGIVLKQ